MILICKKEDFNIPVGTKSICGLGFLHLKNELYDIANQADVVIFYEDSENYEIVKSRHLPKEILKESIKLEV